MWTYSESGISGGAHYCILKGDAPLAFEEFFGLLAGDPAFADWYSVLLAGFGAEAFFWELPPQSRASLGHDTEFVLLEAPGLAGAKPEPRPFSRHFEEDPNADVVVFENLGGDALLVAPTPRDEPESHTHLAVFVRMAAPGQVQAFWRAVAGALLDRLNEKPTWLSSSGLGVHWLHARLDTRPKYYQYAPYRDRAP